MATPSLPISKSRWALAILFVGAGLLHFAVPAPYIRIVPPALPHPSALVALSGLAEILGGLGLLFPQTKRPAALGLVLLLVAVFPANWHMATTPGLFPQIPQWMLWARLPLQLPLIWWASRYARVRKR